MSQKKITFIFCAAVLTLLVAPAWATEHFPDDKAPLSFLGTEFDNLGHVVATGDFDGDGQEDLFIAGPGD